MNKREIRKWVEDAIKKKYDRSDINDILSGMNEKGELSKEDWEKVLKEFDEQKSESEKIELGFFQRWKLKRGLKAVKKLVEEVSIRIQSISKETKKLNKEQLKGLDDLKEKMISAIIGSKKDGKEGLANVFDIRDEEGKIVTETMLRSYKLEEIEELMIDLVEALEKEI